MSIYDRLAERLEVVTAEAQSVTVVLADNVIYHNFENAETKKKFDELEEGEKDSINEALLDASDAMSFNDLMGGETIYVSHDGDWYPAEQPDTLEVEFAMESFNAAKNERSFRINEISRVAASTNNKESTMSSKTTKKELVAALKKIGVEVSKDGKIRRSDLAKATKAAAKKRVTADRLADQIKGNPGAKDKKVVEKAGDAADSGHWLDRHYNVAKAVGNKEAEKHFKYLKEIMEDEGHRPQGLMELANDLFRSVLFQLVQDGWNQEELNRLAWAADDIAMKWYNLDRSSNNSARDNM